ncbi:MAG TPA: nuclear transport factor 2 family protein [Myxococcota bacterium]|nr:nuclear transport factor 2 family protein [Myxococcota bacterium]
MSDTKRLAPSDELEIRNLVARYCLATDNADADGFMACWVAPDEFGGYDSGAFGKLDTWEALYEFEKHHVGPGGLANGKRHVALNLHVEAVDPDTAHVTHDMLVVEVAAAPRLIASGRYDRSVVVRTTDGWRFKQRHLHVDPGFFALMAELGAGH